MLKICTWNIGSFAFLKYAKYLGLTYKGQKITHEYFQPKINGNFVSSYIETANPDIIFLQEFYYPEDAKYIEILRNYPYQKHVDAWYRKDTILIASKAPFQVEEDNTFSIITHGNIKFIPMHLNSYSALKRVEESQILSSIAENISDLIILGDSNIWSRGSHFIFSNDRKAYENLTKKLILFSHEITSTSFVGFALDKVIGSHNLQIKNIVSPKARSHFMDHYPIYFEM